jgi:small conductance mechanosensitive channel
MEFLEYPLVRQGMTIFIILILAVGTNKVLRYLFNRYLENSAETLKVDPTRYRFLKNALTTIIAITALVMIFMSIPALMTIGTTLFAGAGILTVIIGFASQQALSNIVSGVFIVIFKPFRVGDIIRIGNTYGGTVEDITLRHTIIRNFENRRVIVPNSVISSETIENSSIFDPRICNFLMIGISYDSDVDKAIKIIQAEAEKHPDLLDNRTPADLEKGNPIVVVRLIEFSESAVILRASIWSKDPGTGFAMRCDLNRSIKHRFEKEGIEIPYPYRTLVFKNSKAPGNPGLDKSG